MPHRYGRGWWDGRRLTSVTPGTPDRVRTRSRNPRQGPYLSPKLRQRSHHPSRETDTESAYRSRHGPSRSRCERPSLGKPSSVDHSQRDTLCHQPESEVKPRSRPPSWQTNPPRVSPVGNRVAVSGRDLHRQSSWGSSSPRNSSVHSPVTSAVGLRSREGPPWESTHRRIF